jgi:hypothetical protein
MSHGKKGAACEPESPITIACHSLQSCGVFYWGEWQEEMFLYLCETQQFCSEPAAWASSTLEWGTPVLMERWAPCTIPQAALWGLTNEVTLSCDCRHQHILVKTLRKAKWHTDPDPCSQMIKPNPNLISHRGGKRGHIYCLPDCIFAFTLYQCSRT